MHGLQRVEEESDDRRFDPEWWGRRWREGVKFGMYLGIGVEATTDTLALG